MRYLACVVAFLFAILLAKPLWAHANLTRSQPEANAVLAETPPEIRLWFTEPLEEAFSSFTLLDANGEQVELPAAHVDAGDAHQLFARLPPLADGLYSVAWQVVSSADGHGTEGSFPFRIGAGALLMPPTMATHGEAATIPVGSTIIRWFNLLSLALLIGSLAFVLLVWQRAGPGHFPAVERRLAIIQWGAWLGAGVAGALMLRLQAAIVTQASLTAPLNDPIIQQIVTGTRFGALWIARMALWVAVGMFIVLSVRLPRLRWFALAGGAAMLATTSLYSHAGGVQARELAISNDWLHFLLTAVWVGGLASLLAVLVPLRHVLAGDETTRTHITGDLVGHFSNYVRAAVAGLVITGVYAAWLQVGSFQALTTTLYGWSLVAKIVLLLPLMALAAVNLLLTRRRLQAGQAVWVGRLRTLVGVEISLAVAILAAVGALTSLSPARAVMEERALAAAMAAAATIPSPQPIHDLQASAELQLHLTITPGWVGENEFELSVVTLANEPVTDATLIRLRFEDEEQSLGESELRITSGQGGLYTVRGANLSLPGKWRIRTTVQRPDQFDTVVDFMPEVPPAPTPAPPPVRDPATLAEPWPGQLPVLLWLGVGAVGGGLLFLRQAHFRVGQGSGLLATGLVLIGVLFWAYGWLIL